MSILWMKDTKSVIGLMFDLKRRYTLAIKDISVVDGSIIED
jgi:hypothetical protein